VSKDPNAKPMLLKAVETILTDPKTVRAHAMDTLARCRHESPANAPPAEVRARAAKRIVKRYSNLAALAGGATAAVSVVPGIGTIIAVTGGAMSDAALCMKFQLEMTWELATVYGRDIDLQEENNLCYLLAGFGAFNEIAKQGGVRMGMAALANLSRPYLRGAAISAVKMIFKRLGIVFAKKALQKAIPFGIGVGVSIIANKALTHYVGKEVQAFFATTPSKHMPNAAYEANFGPDVVDVDFTEVS
jgi:hypothetical protein